MKIIINIFANDKGIVSIMYHRFNETKYPSTNIQMDIFKKSYKYYKIFKSYIFLNPEILIFFIKKIEKNFN